MSLRTCPRCGDRSFEKLQTYAHCPECLYVEDYWSSSESDFYQALKVMDEYEKAQEEGAEGEPESESENFDSDEVAKGA